MSLSRSRLIPLSLLLLAVAVVWLWDRDRRAKVAHAERLRLESALRALPVFTPAPDITLYDRSETPTKLSSYRGRMVFVNFWATWCGPCVAEMPSLIALQASLDPDEIAFVSIAEDDTWAPVDRWLARNPLPFDVYRDRPPRVEIPFATTSYPTSFLIDREGQAVYRFNGARNWDTDEVRALLALDGVGPR